MIDLLFDARVFPVSAGIPRFMFGETDNSFQNSQQER
jgi:hypothetical protein